MQWSIVYLLDERSAVFLRFGCVLTDNQKIEANTSIILGGQHQDCYCFVGPDILLKISLLINTAFFDIFCLQIQQFTMDEPKRWNTIILVEKSLRIQLINYRAYLTLYLSPLVMLLTLMLYQYVANKNNIWENLTPDIYRLDKIPLCHGEDCRTIAYTVVGEREPYIDYVVSHIKQQNGLPDKQVVEWTRTPQQIMDYLQKHPNKTQTVIIFCTSRWQLNENISIPCYADNHHMNFYTILYNITLFYKTPYLANIKQSYPKDRVVMRLKQDIDEAIIKYHTNSTLQIGLRDFPSRNSRFLTGLNVAAQYGSFFFLIPYLILLVLEVSTLLKEKEDKLRVGLSTVGVTPWQFYLSNFSVSLFNNFIITASLCTFGYVFDFKFFSNGLLWFDFLVLWCNGVVMSLIGLMIVSIANEKKVGMSIAYAFVLYSIVMQWMFTGGFLMMFLYQKTEKKWINLVKAFFNIYPSFHYSKIFSDIERKADRHFDAFQNKWIEGSQFTYNDLFSTTSGSTSIFPQDYVIPSVFDSFINMLLTSLVEVILIWYFDHIIASNRGKADHLLFFLRKQFWKRSTPVASSSTSHRVEVTNALKCFKKHMFRSSNQDIYALKGASFEVQPNEIVSILGRNGAGKSTMIGILTGILDLESGTAKISGMNVQTHMSHLRQRMGVCPQFDILWQELTAYQHMQMFGELKKIPNLINQIERSLRDVQLWQNRDGQIKTFSGGMKRRVSLAISLLGKPELIILDEPTTGMDPKVRRLTWNIIRGLNKYASIIITTHNMEEADCLSDRILIMASGKILAQGSSTALKKQFGSGYSLRIICKDAVTLKNQLASNGIASEIQDQDIIVKSTQQAQLVKILQYLEKDKSQLISEWLISQSSLEEVFLNANKRY